MKNKATTLMLLIVAAIHLLPLAGVLGPARLRSMYGVPIEDTNLAILMQHRAVLFGILGGFLVFAAFRVSLQPAAIAAGGVSVTSFLVIARLAGGYNESLARVMTVDVVALACLFIAAGLRAFGRSPE